MEDITNLGSQLVDYSGPTTSSEALKARLSDTNHTWDDLLDALDKREEGLKGGKEKAVDYQDSLKDLTKWLKEVEEKLDEPERTSGDPQEIARQCTDTKVRKTCSTYCKKVDVFAGILESSRHSFMYVHQSIVYTYVLLFVPLTSESSLIAAHALLE